VAEANPDWLLVIDRGAAVGQGGEAAAATLDNPLIAGTTAGKTGQIVYLDGAAMYLAGGGFHSVTETLAQLTRAFAGAGS
jgi:iron complex transport system substrate-binding protein